MFLDLSFSVAGAVPRAKLQTHFLGAFKWRIATRGCRALRALRDPTRPHEENEIVGVPDPSSIARDVLCMVACAAEGSDGHTEAYISCLVGIQQ